MANAEQVAALRAGGTHWNNWRRMNRNQSIYLGGADLSGTKLHYADLSRVNLSRANLSRAQLSGANLSEADLRGANLIETDLSRANLSEANLREADLSFANLSGSFMSEADLSGADLRMTNLTVSNLSGADLSGAFLREADFRRSNLRRTKMIKADLSAARFMEAILCEANLSEADLSGANFSGADLSEVNLSKANLNGANLSEVNLSKANLSGANLSEVNLSNSHIVRANIGNAKISKSNVYGVNIWDLAGEFNEQKDLTITPEYASPITVDNIKVAQFIYLILKNEEIRDVINTLTSKTVLILGRFGIPERKKILDALRDKLREYNLLPIVFDFDRPAGKDFTETIKTLASISYFVIADVTNPKSSPLELQATIPDYQIPFVPIIQEGEYPFAMMVDLQKKYNWVLDTISYDSLDTLIEILKPHIIDPAIKKRDELRLIKAKEPTIISGRELRSKK